MAQGIVLKNKGNRAFSALILSLGLIAGLISTATPASAAVYAITWNDNGATTASSGRQASYDTTAPGTWAVPTTPPVRTGYTFVTWTTSASGGTAWNFSTKPTGPTTYYAKWNAGSITWDPQGGSTTSGGTASNFAGWPVAALRTAPTRTNYTFVGWFDSISGGNQVTAGSYIPNSASGGVTFYARWTGNPLTVTYNSQEGSTISDGSTSVGGTVADPGDPTRDCHNFDGWFTASTGGSAITFPYTHAQTTNFTLYAQWTFKCTITYNVNGGNAGFTHDGDTTYEPGEPFFRAGDSPERDGFSFNGWFTAAEDGLPIPDDNIVPAPYGPVIYYAQWAALDASDDATLSALAISTGTLNPTFASSTTSYTASVGNSTSSITVTPTVNQANATVEAKVGSGSYSSVTSASASSALALAVGDNTVSVRVTAQNGTTNTYTVTVTRAAASLSADASLSALAISTGTLSPTFASGDTSYTASVGNSTSSITVTPTRNQANATITVNGTSVTSGSASSGISLSVGSNTITVVVTAQNGTTTGTYTITVTRAAPATSTDATLSALAISTGTLSPTFASGDTSYTASVGNSTSSITVTPTRNQANATITVNGTSVTSGSASSGISLSVGSNTITVVVTAQNGTTTGTYTITVTRAAPANNTNTVTWNSQGATTASSGGSATYTNGSSVATIPTTAPQKSGHTFIGWFTGATSGVQVTNASFTPASPYADVTFYAHWTVNRSSSVGTWAWTNQSSAGERKWHALATSADGSKLFAGVDDGGSLYRSTDFGVTWSVIAGTSGKNWFSIASNIDGTKVAAVDRGGDIWTSTNSGSTWTQRSVGDVRNWESIASSSDGAKLVAVASNGDNNGYIYTSSNSGVSWSSDLAPAGTNKFTGVASSNDGTYLAATTWANGIYTSSNSGQTWTARTLPVPNPSGVTYLQAVASSGDGSRLVTGSRTQAGGSNGGVIFTSADYGATWKAFSQTSLDYINFTSNGDGSRLAAAIYGQAGVSTSADFGATWTFQSVGLNGDIPIASNIDGSLLFVGGYGGNLWTGKIPNARVVAVLPASTSASLAASASTPATALSFSASNAAAAMTVTPISNPATEAATPFSVAQASVFDISVVNVSGQVTVCVDGGPNVRLWHFTNGAWVDVTTSQTTTQTCGVTSSFSPFATGPVATPLLIATPTVVDTGSARREAEMRSARADITSKLQSTQELSVETFAKAEIRGITASNIAAVQAEILALPEEARTNIKEVLKVARKFEVVGNIASTQVRNMSATSFVEIGLIPASSKNKVALVAAIRKLPASARDTYAEIKAAIDAETARIKSRSDRLAAIVARKTTKSTQK